MSQLGAFTDATYMLTAVFRVFDPSIEKHLPEVYLIATGQILTFLFAIAWTLTWFYNPEIVRSNPLKDRIGYNNVCVGFDSPPAVYVAQVLFIPQAYLVFQFALLDWKRSVLVRDRLSAFQFHLSRVTDILFMISISLFSLVFVIPPEKSHWGHSLAFIQFIVVWFLVIAANVYEQAEPIPLKSKIYLVVFGSSSFAFPILLIIDFILYDNAVARGEVPSGPAIPWYIVEFWDLLWFASLALSWFFVPKGETLEVVNELGVDGSISSGSESPERPPCCIPASLSYRHRRPLPLP